jgi:hypothetical protein
METQVRPNATQSIQKVSYHFSHFLFCADDPQVPLASGSSAILNKQLDLT